MYLQRPCSSSQLSRGKRLRLASIVTNAKFHSHGTYEERNGGFLILTLRLFQPELASVSEYAVNPSSAKWNFDGEPWVHGPRYHEAGGFQGVKVLCRCLLGHGRSP